MDSNNSTTTTVVTHEGSTPPPVATPTGKAKVAVSPYTRATDAALIVLTGLIIKGMLGNPAYASTNPKLAEFVTARNSYIDAVEAARDSTIAVAGRRQQKSALLALVRKLAHYVQVTSGGDLPTLLSSGFTAQRTRQPVGRLPAPLNLRLVRGKASGEIDARFSKLEKAGAYEWRYANAAAPTVWTRADTTLAAKTTLTGLEPGTQYIVQVRAVGTAGASDWSDAAMLMAA